VASLTTPAFSAVSGGIGCLACTALIGLAFPAFTRHRARQDPARPRAAAGAGPKTGPA
jgi:hypothetical protein